MTSLSAHNTKNSYSDAVTQ